jgi:hypothetical protein
MSESTLRSDATLPEFLAARARQSSDPRLAAHVAIGVLAAAAVLFWHPRGWIPLLAAALCFAAFGLWGIADRALETSPGRALRTLRASAAVLGAIAGLALAFGLVAYGLGTIIS